MRTLDFTFDSITSLISPETSLEVLAGLIKDMDLEVVDVKAA